MSLKCKAIVLAAGKSTRFDSPIPKAIFQLLGKPLAQYSIDTVKHLPCDEVIVVVGYKAEEVKKVLSQNIVTFVHQKHQLGTGDAVKASIDLWKDYDGYLAIFCADTPLLTRDTLLSAWKVIETHVNEKDFGGIIFTAITENPFSYGRIIKSNENVTQIIEEKEATDEQRQIKEVNSGLYILYAPMITQLIEQIQPSAVKHEYYFTDIVELASKAGWKIQSFPVSNFDEIHGINTMEEFTQAETILIKHATNEG
jgi:bifunctional UDP-N-acetylglucosamine pyrophosphorylase/glucosamine-1-phosphate N-acetyltransferase